MKLDYDCVRNALLTVESLPPGCTLDDRCLHAYPLLNGYSREQIDYTVQRIAEAGFVPVNSVIKTLSGVIYSISDLTWDGHQHLDYIRNDSVWSEIRKRISHGNIPFEAIIGIAKDLLG